MLSFHFKYCSHFRQFRNSFLRWLWNDDGLNETHIFNDPELRRLLATDSYSLHNHKDKQIEFNLRKSFINRSLRLDTFVQYSLTSLVHHSNCIKLIKTSISLFMKMLHLRHIGSAKHKLECIDIYERNEYLIPLTLTGRFVSFSFYFIFSIVTKTILYI